MQIPYAFLKSGRAFNRYKEVSGFEGIVAACLVAIKQIMPDNEIMLLTGVIRFRAKVGTPEQIHANEELLLEDFTYLALTGALQQLGTLTCILCVAAPS